MTWRTVPLGEIARVDARTIKPDELETEDVYVGLEHIRRDGSVDLTTAAADAGLRSAKNRFDARHILYGKLRPNLGKVACPGTKGVCSTDIYPLLPTEHADRNFLAHYLLTPDVVRFTSARTTGVNLPRISWSSLGKLPVPLPPLSEQRRIASILDEAGEVRAVQQRIIASLDELAAAAFRDLESTLRGPHIPLGDIAEVSSGITKGRKAPAGDLVPVDYMTVANVQEKRLDLSVVRQLNVSRREIERYRLRAGDLLLTEGGDPDKLGRGVVWGDELPLSIHQNHVFRVRLRDDRLSPIWLNWEMGSAYGKRYFLRAAKQTTGIATINSTQLRAFPVRIAASEHTRDFLAKLDAIRSVRAGAVAESAAFDALFASLQHRAFRAEL